MTDTRTERAPGRTPEHGRHRVRDSVPDSVRGSVRHSVRDSVRDSVRGSALVEAVVLMVVLVPIMFGVVMIGKLIDLKQTGEQASRYAAWEATVHAPDSPQGARPAAVRERFFGKRENAISSSPHEPGNHQLWGAQASTDDVSWASRTAIRIDPESIDAQHYAYGVGEPTVAMQVGRAAASAGKVLDGVRGNQWGLAADGLVRATVGVQVKSNDWLTAPGQGKGKGQGQGQGQGQVCGAADNFACLHSSTVIMADGWSSSSDQQAAERVRSLVPLSALEPLGNIISRVGHIPMLKELKKLDGALGHVDMSVLPAYARP